MKEDVKNASSRDFLTNASQRVPIKLQIQRLQGFEERPLLCKIVCKLEKEKIYMKRKTYCQVTAG